MTAALTPFALGFMTISMVLVTGLAGYCLWRILRSQGPGPSAPPPETDGPEPHG